MATVQTYQGMVVKGQIQLSAKPDLPEGSQVYVIVAGQDPLLAEQTAQRQATRWLVENVGNMLLASGGRLVDVGGVIAWQFGAFITGRGHKPQGPIGFVNVDAHDGVILMSEEEAAEIIAHGTAFVRSLP